MNNKKKAEHRQKSKEVFLEHKRKKKWVDINKSKHYCWMLYPRALYITNIDYWDWKCFKETSDDNIEVVKLRAVCWLDVRGKLKMSELTTGITYKIVYVVKLTESSSGWELPMNLRLSVPGKNVQERQVSFLNLPKGQWTELDMGNVVAKGGETEEINFDIYEHGGHWKTGLIIKGVIIRPIA